MRKLFTILALFVVAAFTMAATARERANESVLTGDKVVECAKKYLGTRYRSGGMSPKRGFDCSGFTSFIYSNHDIVLPHSSRSQFATLKGDNLVEKTSDLRVGDLVFFSGSRKSKTVGHVGIVTSVDDLGGFEFIHSSCSSGVIVSKSTEAYYANRYIGACRVIED